MKDLILALPKGKQPKYLKLADGLRAAIRSGRIKPGEVLPSSRELARCFAFHRHTVMNALAELEAEGWVEAREKQHYRVVDTLPSTFLRARIPAKRLPSGRAADFSLARPLGLADYLPQRGFRHNFHSTLPDSRLFPLREFKSHLYDALRSKDVLHYGDPAGQSRLLEQVAVYLRRVRNITGRQILVTNGSQEAIFYLAQLLVRPGDRVAVEALGYRPAVEALRFAGAELVPIEVDADGFVVEDFEHQLKRGRIRLLYLTPLHQYPTTVTLSASRRLRLYELACKHNVMILEDDYDHEFHYTSQPVAPLASFDPAGIVFYVSTFSKILFPSARVGFLAVPERVGREVAKLKRISSRQNEPLLQEAIALWMEAGGFERHLRRMRRAYAERLEAMVETLSELKNERPGLSWATPGGGMALWLDIGMDSEMAASRAKAADILVYPESNYRLDGKAGTHFRLGFSGQTVEENRAGLKALVKALGPRGA